MYKSTIRKNREPLDSTEEFHNLMNNMNRLKQKYLKEYKNDWRQNWTILKWSNKNENF